MELFYDIRLLTDVYIEETTENHIVSGNNLDHYPVVKGVLIPEFSTWAPVLLALLVVAAAVTYIGDLMNLNSPLNQKILYVSV